VRITYVDETIDAVSRRYRPHVVRVRSNNGTLSLDLEASLVCAMQIVNLRYSARVTSPHDGPVPLIPEQSR
jgi:hypothetical protein